MVLKNYVVKIVGTVFSILKLFYFQGAAVIQMCENFLGKETFQLGLKGYLNEHKYGNAETDDLWAALSKQVRDLRENWKLPGVGSATSCPGLLSQSKRLFLKLI